MIGAPSGVKVHIACGVTDMRKGIDGLATLVQEVLLHDPFSGHLFAFRGGRANLIKILYWDGTGLCLFTKRLEHRIFEWPTVEHHQPDIGAARHADRGHRLAIAGPQLATGRCGLDSRPRLIESLTRNEVTDGPPTGVKSAHENRSRCPADRRHCIA